MNRTRIKEIFLANGFKEKLQGEDPASGAGEGLYDLNPYVYLAAEALLAANRCNLISQLSDQCVPDTAGIEAMSPMDAYSAGVSTALEARLPAGDVIDLSQLSWQAIQSAASESTWMPPEYMMNDWVSDVCSFLIGPTGNADQARSDNQFYTKALLLRACKALGLDPDSCSWFDVVGKLESTPSSNWKAAGEPDPHAGHYDGERATLALGHLTDDQLANAAFLGYDKVLDIHRILAKDPDYHSPIALMTAVKDRIRWLSRKLEAAPAPKVGSASQLCGLMANHFRRALSYQHSLDVVESLILKENRGLLGKKDTILLQKLRDNGLVDKK